MVAENKNRWIVIDGARYNLGSMKRLGISDKNWGTGVSLEEVYLMPRAKKVIVETYSTWENPKTHNCYGRNYEIAGPNLIATLAADTGNSDLMSLVPEAIQDTER